MKQVGVIANCGKPHAQPILKQVATAAAQRGLALVTFDDTGDLLPDAKRLDREQFVASIDALMALGGDGTMLRAVRTLSGRDVPVVGVNLGSLGFMTSVPEDEAERAVEVLAEGNYTTSQRAMARATVLRNGAAAAQYTALNDIVIGWGANSRVIALTVRIDGTEVTTYTCDGLIFSTPTGSTGHSLSAGGPILHPESPAFVLTVICPHTLSTRPLVVPDTSVVDIALSRAPKSLILAVDGQEGQALEEGDRLEIARNPSGVRFIHLPGYSYFSVLRQKLGWRGSSY